MKKQVKKQTGMDFSKLVEAFSRTHTELQRQATRAVDSSLVARNWLFGLYLVEYEQYGSDRAKYGERLLETLAEQLKIKGIGGLGLSYLRACRQFYSSYASIRQTLSGELLSIDGQTDTTIIGGGIRRKRSGQTVSDHSRCQIGQAMSRLLPEPIVQTWSELSGSNGRIRQTLSGELAVTGTEQNLQTLSGELARRFRLSWSHYAFLLTIDNRAERDFYEQAALAENWSLRGLKRQFGSSLYERLALSRKKKPLPVEVTPTTPAEAVKDPYVLEFLELADRPEYSEQELETALIDKLQHFLLELGKGFLFQARQYRFTYDDQHFRVDLVFYHRLLRCFVLIDLKIDRLTHQDLGQMQMYVNYFDRQVKTSEENPTIGIVLCKTKNDALVEMTLPRGNQAIFASKYQLYLPSKAELRAQLASLPAIAPETKRRNPMRKGGRLSSRLRRRQ